MWAFMVFAEMFWPPGINFLSPLEAVERLEQLRLIEAGLTIATFPVAGTSLSVDTSDQLEQAREILSEYTSLN